MVAVAVMRSETATQRLARARIYWPAARDDDIVWIEPLGSRQDALLFWRKECRVVTGTRGDKACFEGSLDDFEAKVIADYDARQDAYHDGSPARKDLTAHKAAYLAAAAFFRALVGEEENANTALVEEPAG